MQCCSKVNMMRQGPKCSWPLHVQSLEGNVGIYLARPYPADLFFGVDHIAFGFNAIVCAFSPPLVCGFALLCMSIFATLRVCLRHRLCVHSRHLECVDLCHLVLCLLFFQLCVCFRPLVRVWFRNLFCGCVLFTPCVCLFLVPRLCLLRSPCVGVWF